ncbi:hypothetical protein [Amycolatopsis taiwanensis]|uniref:Uncharacterized protein n=1 Tax=Amycolatopsis taiwanensis TaxID=342230 RepID=A0A9W6R8I4_9PSEU|nr:hypothetical protein [Amycolatopsis taiwanensis]GLY70828.1 hypothetical protein Atai01_74470 [Amycolatopsis taiwanensis]
MVGSLLGTVLGPREAIWVAVSGMVLAPLAVLHLSQVRHYRSLTKYRLTTKDGKAGQDGTFALHDRYDRVPDLERTIRQLDRRRPWPELDPVTVGFPGRAPPEPVRLLRSGELRELGIRQNILHSVIVVTHRGHRYVLDRRLSRMPELIGRILAAQAKFRPLTRPGGRLAALRALGTAIRHPVVSSRKRAARARVLARWEARRQSSNARLRLLIQARQIDNEEKGKTMRQRLAFPSVPRLLRRRLHQEGTPRVSKSPSTLAWPVSATAKTRTAAT